MLCRIGSLIPLSAVMKNKFACAFNGLAEGWKHRSVRIQYILARLAVTAGMIMRLSLLEWAIVIVCIGCVVTAEMLNTCVEKICDMYTEKKDERVRVIKDIAAGAVLASSLCALGAAIMILIRHIV